MFGDINSTKAFVRLVSYSVRFNIPRRFGDVPLASVPFVDVSECIYYVKVVLEREKLSIGDYGNGVTEDYGIAANASNFR